MSPRGGKREGAGRKSRGLPTTKITVFKETHEIINKYAKEKGLSVVDFMYLTIKDSKFETFLSSIDFSK